MKPTSSTTALAKQMANSIWNSQTDLQERIVDGRLSLTKGEMDLTIGYSLFSLKRKGGFSSSKVDVNQAIVIATDTLDKKGLKIEVV